MPKQMYLSTLSEDVPELAEKYKLGLELDQFCTAVNMDENFSVWDQSVQNCLSRTAQFVLHAPFAEIAPSAIDPLVRNVSMKRLSQAAGLAQHYGIHRMVVHTGFIPNVYFPEWYWDQGVQFFQELLKTLPEDFELLIENVLDPNPDILKTTIDRIGDPRARACLDVGHAYCVSKVPLSEWLDALAPVLAHLHLHDNDASFDLHMPPGDGTIGFPKLFETLDERVPDATWTFECPDAKGCIRNLQRFGIL